MTDGERDALHVATTVTILGLGLFAGAALAHDVAMAIFSAIAVSVIVTRTFTAWDKRRQARVLGGKR